MTITINGSEGITLNNGSADGAQVTLSSSGYNDWNIDNYNGTLRAYNNGTEQFKVTNTGNLQFNSGYGSVATAYACRAWVNFNGSGTPAISGSGNVSSITDIGVGLFRANFTTAMPDANYSASCTARREVTWINGGCQAQEYTTGYVGVQIVENGVGQDSGIISVQVFR